MLYAVGEKPREKEEKPTIGSRLNASWIFLCSAQQNLSQKQREEEEKKKTFSATTDFMLCKFYGAILWSPPLQHQLAALDILLHVFLWSQGEDSGREDRSEIAKAKVVVGANGDKEKRETVKFQFSFALESLHIARRDSLCVCKASNVYMQSLLERSTEKKIVKNSLQEQKI